MFREVERSLHIAAAYRPEQRREPLGIGLIHFRLAVPLKIARFSTSFPSPPTGFTSA
jgi:hypothetical protein